MIETTNSPLYSKHQQITNYPEYVFYNYNLHEFIAIQKAQ